MKCIRFLVVSFSMLVAVNLSAQIQIAEPVSQPPAAAEILSRATADAASQNKKVLLMFHASWCVWCHRMDSSLNDALCKKYFTDNFVIAHITVMESAGKEDLENAGGMEILEKYEGKDMGLPYWVILDKDAALLFDARITTTSAKGKEKQGSIGCPATQAEVDKFIAILKKTTSLTDAELAVIAKRFRKNEKK